MPIQDQVSSLRKVYVRAPEADAASAWRDYAWRVEPDPAKAAAEHEAFRAALADAGADVIVGSAPSGGDPDAIYVYDPVLMTDAGAVLLRPGKPGRRAETEVARRDLEAAGIPVIAALGEPSLAEGGDLCWLDRHTLLAGLGYRTNEAGVAELRGLLVEQGAEVIAFDLPHLAGPERVHPPALVPLAPGRRPRGRLRPAAAGPTRPAAGGPRDRDRRGSRRRGRLHGSERPGARAPGGADARRQPGDTPADGGCGCGRADLRRRVDLPRRRRRPDLPDEAPRARLTPPPASVTSGRDPGSRQLYGPVSTWRSTATSPCCAAHR